MARKLRGQINVRLDVDDLARLEAIQSRTHEDISALVRRLLRAEAEIT